MKKDLFYLIIILILILALFKFGDFGGNQPPNDSYKKHIISIDRAKNLREEYLNYRKKLFQIQLRKVYNDSTFEETEFVWFSLESFKSYINFIDNIQKHHPDEDISGLRLYFMAYPNSAKKYKGQQSIFMVPTVRYKYDNNSYETMNNLPFYLSAVDPNAPYSGKVTLYKELMSSYLLKNRINNFNEKNINATSKAGFNYPLNPFNISNTELTNTSTLFNEGEAYPPPKKTNDN